MMRSAIVFILLLATPAIAGVIRQPTDLSPGDQYRLIFVTSKTRDATSTNIEDYNDFVQSLADESPAVGDWGLEWKVVGGTATVSARDNINHPGVPVYRLDGSLYSRADPDGRRFWGIDNRSANLTELETQLPLHNL